MAKPVKRAPNLTPVQILVGSFLALIIAGASLLMLPECQARQGGIGFLNCLFTSTSAVCVTGLIVVDTATAWTRLGQIVIVILIQLGGIGIVTFGAFFALLLGQKISFRQRALLKEQYGQSAVLNIFHIVPVVAGTTFVIEGLGAILLYPSFQGEFAPGEAAYHCVFHAISAFCNAGFSTFSDNLMHFQGSMMVNLVVMVLIVLGGLGFPVIAELLERRNVRRRMTLHSRVVLYSTSVLIVGGAIVFFLIESGFDPGFGALPLHNRIFASFFQSVTARTAGFNTLDIGSLAPANLLILTLLMFIGGSPSGTAGGIKTTTLVAGLASVRAVLLGRAEPVILDRRLSRDVTRRAMVLIVLSIGLLFVCLVLLTLAGEGDLLKLVFEAVSAFGTVGLSTGITFSLTSGQRIVIILLMFIGRLGPMTFALALAKPRVEHVRFPETDLLTG
jgi:trk system potassium uptake protein TrkH